MDDEKLGTGFMPALRQPLWWSCQGLSDWAYQFETPKASSFVSKMQPSSTLQCEECSVLFLYWPIIKHTGAKTHSGAWSLEFCYSKYFVTDTHYLSQPPTYQALEQTFGLLGWNQMDLGSNFISAVQHNIYPSSGLTASPESRLRQIRKKNITREEWRKWNNPRVRTHKILYPHFISTRSQTHSLHGATQCHFPSPRLVPLATCSEPGLGLIDSNTTSPLMAKTRCREVGLWVAGTALRMETNGLEIFRGWLCEGELNMIVFHGSTG